MIQPYIYNYTALLRYNDELCILGAKGELARLEKDTSSLHSDHFDYRRGEKVLLKHLDAVVQCFLASVLG